MAMFLLRGSYRLLVAVCFLLGVNVFTIYVLNQTGGLSPGKILRMRQICAYQHPLQKNGPVSLSQIY